MEGDLPTQQMPFVWGDLNACGWAGGGDESIYALDRDALAEIPARDGMPVFVWWEDEPGTILGCVANLRPRRISSVRANAHTSLLAGRRPGP